MTTWMLTASGTVFELHHVDQASISIADIAHHLAQINRYTGACSRPYSVAEHSLLVCELLQINGETDPSVLMAGLMHDAHEAYTQDLSSPMKKLVGDAWYDVECRVQHAVLKRFGLITPYTSARERIEWADLTALMTERHYLLPPKGPTWFAEASHPAVTWNFFGPRGANTWADWRQAFIDKFDELQFLRVERAGDVAGHSHHPV